MSIHHVLLIAVLFAPTLAGAQQLQGPRFPDAAARQADVDEREARARAQQPQNDRQLQEAIKQGEDQYGQFHPEMSRTGDAPGVPYVPDTSERSVVNPCMTYGGSRVADCRR